MCITITFQEDGIFILGSFKTLIVILFPEREKLSRQSNSFIFVKLDLHPRSVQR